MPSGVESHVLGSEVRGTTKSIVGGSPQRWLLLHALIFLFAIAVRLSLAAVFVGLAAPPKGDANPDQLEYELFAYHLSHGDGFVLEPNKPSGCRPPGTSFFLVPIYVVLGRSWLAGRVWFCLISAACCPIVGWIAHRLAGWQTGLLAALWLAFYPGHAYYAMHFLSEAPTTLLTAVAVTYQIEGYRRQSSRMNLCAGLAWGLGILVRPNLAVAAGLCVLITLLAGTARWRFCIQQTLLLTAMAVLVVAPWAARNAAVMGKTAICTIVGGYTFWGAHNQRVVQDSNLLGYWVPSSTLIDSEHPLIGTEVERETKAWEYGWMFLRSHTHGLFVMKWHALLRVVWAYSEAGNKTVDLGFRLSWLASLPFVLIGLMRLARKTPVETLYLITPLVAVLFTAMMFYGCSRFRDSAAPMLAVFVAVGVRTVSTRLRRRPIHT